MAAREWDPDQYEKFAGLRTLPFLDLSALISTDRPIRLMVDLGCGTGKLTAQLADRLGVKQVIGIDSSPAMLASAEGHQRRNLRFEHGDIGTWSGTGTGPVDLLVANASLQWVADHRAVLARWVGALAAGGQLVVQVPANADHPAHLSVDVVARSDRFAAAFSQTDDGVIPPDLVAANVLAPEYYAEVLYQLGFANPQVRLQVYPQVMETSAAVVDWVAGTTLTRVFRRLPEDLHQPFLEAYRRELLSRIGDREPYFYAFKRILMHGQLTR